MVISLVSHSVNSQYHGHAPSTPAYSFNSQKKLLGRNTSHILPGPQNSWKQHCQIIKDGVGNRNGSWQCDESQWNLTTTQAVFWLHTRIWQQKTKLARLCVKYQQCSFQLHFCSTNNQKSAYYHCNTCFLWTGIHFLLLRHDLTSTV